MLSGRRKRIIFSADNIISTLNIELAKYFNVGFNEFFDSSSSSSRFTIDHNEQPRYCFMSENFENIVDNYLKKNEFNHINEYTNFEELLSLVNMQKTVDDMVLI